MKIEKLILGAVRTNCYFVINEKSQETIIVDPSDRADSIQSFLLDMGLKPVGILLTHGHFDHIMAVDELRNQFQIKVYAHQAEQEILMNSEFNLSLMFGSPFVTKADVLVEDGETIQLAGFQIRCIHTPGHTQGGMCYYFADEEVLFSGDTLFYESYGRIDFPSGSAGTLTRSIKEKLFCLPDNTRVFPGHEAETQMGHEKMYNPI